MRAAWNHSIHYYDEVLRLVPRDCGAALDVGCGQGLLAHRLATVCRSVVAMDLAEGAFCGGDANVRFVLGDAMTYPLEAGGFDVVTAVAMLHHVPLEPGLVRLAHLVRPGGVLVVMGLYRSCGFLDMLNAAVALPVSLVMRTFRGMSGVGAPVCEPKETLREIRRAAAILLPGSILHRKLLFRYVLVWRKPLL